MRYIFLITFLLFSFSPHPMHMAVTEIEYKPAAKTLQITHKIFIDDLEKHIETLAEKSGKPLKLYLGSPKENPESDIYLKEYLQKYFTLKINGKTYQPKFLGKEVETEAIWVYAEITNIKNPSDFQIQDSILMDLYEDQNNLAHFKISDQKKSLRFKKDEQTQKIKF